MLRKACAAATALVLAVPAMAEEPGGQDSVELAKALANPIANLISVPFKVNWDTGIGPANADRTTVLFQPVIPFEISDDWNLITRTIVPYISAQSPFGVGGTQSGFSDTTQSFFFSPKAPTGDGWIWGVGPVFLYPTATNGLLSTGKWGAGLTAIALRAKDGWTTGMLVNHIWSVAGRSDREEVNLTYTQPFVAYTFKTATTLGLTSETTYDWRGREWTVPVNAYVSQILPIGEQPASITLLGRYYADKPDGGPDWGVTVVFTLLFKAH